MSFHDPNEYTQTSVRSHITNNHARTHPTVLCCLSIYNLETWPTSVTQSVRTWTYPTYRNKVVVAYSTSVLSLIDRYISSAANHLHIHKCIHENFVYAFEYQYLLTSFHFQLHAKYVSGINETICTNDFLLRRKWNIREYIFLFFFCLFFWYWFSSESIEIIIYYCNFKLIQCDLVSLRCLSFWARTSQAFLIVFGNNINVKVSIQNI